MKIFFILFFCLLTSAAYPNCLKTMNDVENKIGLGKGAWLADWKNQCFEKVYLIHHDPKLTKVEKDQLCEEISKKLSSGKFIVSKNCDTRN